MKAERCYDPSQQNQQQHEQNRPGIRLSSLEMLDKSSSKGQVFIGTKSPH